MRAKVNRLRKSSTRRGLKSPERWVWLGLRLPLAGEEARKNSAPWMGGLALVAFAVFGAVVGSRDENREQALPDDVFVIEDQVPQPPPPEPPPPPPPPPPPSDPEPEPPKPEIEPEEIPPPQFGLAEEALGEVGELAVATGNTVMTAADTVVLPPPPPLPPAPQMLDAPPRILKGEPPVYPARALDLGLEGTVVALITIDTLGAVTEVVIEKSGGRDFDHAVLKVARATLFQPPTRQGNRVSARFRRPYEFRLE